jgi:pyruvate dehydrogenase E2 component (dihydrolipoamide acetyltransferase)
MPSLGADMDQGTLLEWLVQPGDTVHRGDIVAVVDTAKAAVEVECFTTGVVESLLVEPGTTVPVGAVLATIAETAPSVPTRKKALGEKPSRKKPERKAARAKPAPSPPRTAVTAEPPVSSPLVRHLAHERHVDLTAIHGTGPEGSITRADLEHALTQRRQPRLRASPLARRLAAELGIDLANVTGTGRDGTIREADVRSAAAGQQVSTSTVSLTPVTPHPAGKPATEDRHGREGAPAAAEPSALRRAVAELMARSKREIPHYYLSTTVDMATATAWLQNHNRQVAVTDRLIPAALLLKAAALAARTVPELNGFWTDDRFIPGEDVHLGVAVAVRGGGVVAPALHHAADLSVPDLMATLRDLAARAKAGRLRHTELADPTITVTNLGDLGVETVFGVIFPPQVALVGVGKVVERPWAIDGMLGVRPVVTVTLSADHRATDGHTGARYLEHLAQLLQKPEEL